MKLTIKRSELLRAVRTARQLTKQSNKYFHLIAENNTLTVYSTTGPFCTIPIEADITMNGKIQVERRQFQRILELLGTERVHLSWEKDKLNLNDTVHIKAEESLFYPNTYAPPTFSVDFPTLRKSIERVLVSAHTDENRPNLCYVKNMIKDGVWSMVSTNEFVLSLVSMIFTDWEGEFLLHQSELRKLASYKMKGEARFSMNEGGVYWQLPGDVYLFTLLGDEKYPVYESVFPKRWYTRIKVNATELKRHLMMCDLFGIYVELGISPERMIISTMDDDAQYCDWMTLKDFEGENLKIRFDPHLLQKSLVDGDVEMEFTSLHNPGVIKTKDYMGVIMPMNTPR